MTDTTTHEQLEQRIYAALADFGLKPESIRPEATLAELNLDSLDLVELAQIVEDEYGVQITAEDASGITTVGEAIEMVASKLP